MNRDDLTAMSFLTNRLRHLQQQRVQLEKDKNIIGSIKVDSTLETTVCNLQIPSEMRDEVYMILVNTVKNVELHLESEIKTLAKRLVK